MRPFLKWAGNKFKLMTRIEAALRAGARLVEPFAGSAAVFLNTDYPRYLIADANADLIGLYRFVQAEGPAFIAYCRRFFSDDANSAEVFYARRSAFNSIGNLRLKAALFLYLNRHCFNGLCRYNSKGKFNVPFGRYARPYFPAAEMLYFHQKAQTARFVHAPFQEVMQATRPGDVVYCDPPYVPLSSTAHFTSYSAAKFGMPEQEQLAALAERLAARGVPVVVSNHHTEFTQRAYRRAQVDTFDVRRHISCNGSNRSYVTEVLALFS